MSAISILKVNEKNFQGCLKNIPDTVDGVCSHHNPTGIPALGLPISSQVWDLVKIYHGTSDRKGMFGNVPDGYVSELTFEENGITGRQVVYLKKKNGFYSVYAGITNADDPEKISIKGGYTVASTGLPGFRGTAIMLAFMPLILDNEEAIYLFDSLKSYAEKDENDKSFWTKAELENCARLLALLGDNIRSRKDNANPVDENALPFPKDSKAIKMISLDVFKKQVMNPHGEAFLFQATSFEKILGELSLSNLVDFTEEEKQMIPVMKSNFIWSDWIVSACKRINRSSRYAEPIRTCYFIGPAGCGKSLGTMAMASVLGLPYDHITCHPNMEVFDFLGQIYPNTSADGGKAMSFDDVRIQLGLPSLEDIMLDTENAYIRTFKKECPANVSPEEVISEVMNRVYGRMTELCNNKDYVFVEGVLTKAIKRGYLVEVQEIGIIKRPGVAVGLNAILESGSNSFITLPTGETIEKNKNCVIVFTSNDEYEDTNNLNQSVLSRMGHVVWFKNSSAEVMAKRAKSVVTDFYDDTLLLKMAEMIEEISHFLKTKGITDGVCGQRELTNWAMEVMLEMEDQSVDTASDEIMRTTCQTAVLGKVAQNEEDIVDVAEGIVDPIYGPLPLRI